MVREVDSIRDAILMILTEDPSLSKYRLAKELNVSTASLLNNYINGTTKKAGPAIMKAVYERYGILVSDFKEFMVIHSPSVEEEEEEAPTEIADANWEEDNDF